MKTPQGGPVATNHSIISVHLYLHMHIYTYNGCNCVTYNLIMSILCITCNYESWSDITQTLLLQRRHNVQLRMAILAKRIRTTLFVQLKNTIAYLFVLQRERFIVVLTIIVAYFQEIAQWKEIQNSVVNPLTEGRSKSTLAAED